MPIPLEILLSLSLVIYPERELLDHTVVLFSIFWGNFILLFTVSAPVYIPTSSAEGFSFLHILVNLTLDNLALIFWWPEHQLCCFLILYSGTNYIPYRHNYICASNLFFKMELFFYHSMLNEDQMRWNTSVMYAVLLSNISHQHMILISLSLPKSKLHQRSYLLINSKSFQAFKSSSSSHRANFFLWFKSSDIESFLLSLLKVSWNAFFKHRFVQSF